ncbi:hypothetical protein L873DRAFT_1795733 [Choiromyces venosus 120613-1]|uniref:Uncharacterized protein n=1 Tax=Choiromyces venosus 120613-1 TaxID=1336337 RepID=A0A3N4IVQ8_9PEZI|nr:hypothetical protein L873DRAFT_1795733 [Choiromyces venosus 120613-1]
MAVHFEDLHLQFEDLRLRFEDLRIQLDGIKQQLQAAGFNSLARFENSSLTRTSGSQLSTLRKAQNKHVNGFPHTLGHLDPLSSGNVNALLTAYGLPTEGPVAERRRRLKKLIGVTAAGI